MLVLKLSNENESYFVAFKYDESIYTCLKEWGILSLSSSKVVQFKLVEPGVYVFKQ
jgi:hypothetical protein